MWSESGDSQGPLSGDSHRPLKDPNTPRKFDFWRWCCGSRDKSGTGQQDQTPESHGLKQISIEDSSETGAPGAGIADKPGLSRLASSFSDTSILSNMSEAIKERKRKQPVDARFQRLGELLGPQFMQLDEQKAFNTEWYQQKNAEIKKYQGIYDNITLNMDFELRLNEQNYTERRLTILREYGESLIFIYDQYSKNNQNMESTQGDQDIVAKRRQIKQAQKSYGTLHEHYKLISQKYASQIYDAFVSYLDKSSTLLQKKLKYQEQKSNNKGLEELEKANLESEKEKVSAQINKMRNKMKRITTNKNLGLIPENRGMADLFKELISDPEAMSQASSPRQHPYAGSEHSDHQLTLNNYKFYMKNRNSQALQDALQSREDKLQEERDQLNTVAESSTWEGATETGDTGKASTSGREDGTSNPYFEKGSEELKSLMPPPKPLDEEALLRAYPMLKSASSTNFTETPAPDSSIGGDSEDPSS